MSFRVLRLKSLILALHDESTSLEVADTGIDHHMPGASDVCLKALKSNFCWGVMLREIML